LLYAAHARRVPASSSRSFSVSVAKALMPRLLP
jgi:hypothetical protein